MAFIYNIQNGPNPAPREVNSKTFIDFSGHGSSSVLVPFVAYQCEKYYGNLHLEKLYNQVEFEQ